MLQLEPCKGAVRASVQSHGKYVYDVTGVQNIEMLMYITLSVYLHSGINSTDLTLSDPNSKARQATTTSQICVDHRSIQGGIGVVIT